VTMRDRELTRREFMKLTSTGIAVAVVPRRAFSSPGRGITGMLRTEVNELEVRVTNLWPNRLIGDEQFPDDYSRNGEWKSGVIPAMPEWLKKGTAPPESRRLTFCTWKHWHKDDALLPSGLLGPVMLRQARIAAVITS